MGHHARMTVPCRTIRSGVKPVPIQSRSTFPYRPYRLAWLWWSLASLMDPVATGVPRPPRELQGVPLVSKCHSKKSLLHSQTLWSRQIRIIYQFTQWSTLGKVRKLAASALWGAHACQVNLCRIWMENLWVCYCHVPHLDESMDLDDRSRCRWLRTGSLDLGTYWWIFPLYARYET